MSELLDAIGAPDELTARRLLVLLSLCAGGAEHAADTAA